MARLMKKDFKQSKRLRGLKKKIEELAILCDIEAFLLCFEEGVDDSSACSCSWPEDQRVCLSLINKYKNSLKEAKKKKMKKVDDGTSRSLTTKKNRIDRRPRRFSRPVEEREVDIDFEMGSLLSLEGLGFDALQGILHGVDQKLTAVNEGIQFLKTRTQGLNGRERINGGSM